MPREATDTMMTADPGPTGATTAILSMAPVATPAVYSAGLYYEQVEHLLVDRPLRHQTFRPLPRTDGAADAAELTLDQAADLMAVRPAWLAEQWDAAAMPYRGEGADRRLAATDLERFRADLYRRRCQTLEELAAWDQEIGLV